MKTISKEIKVGLAVVAALLLLIYGMNFLNGISLFQSNNLYYVKFSDVSGLAKANPVYANGYPIGIVKSIEYDYKNHGNVCVGVEVDENVHITEGSYALLDAQMLGGVTMNIVMGKSPRSLSPGDTITGGPKIGALDVAGQMMPQLQAMVPKLDSILTSVNSLLANPALQQTIVNASELTRQLTTTTATLNTLLAENVTPMMQNLQPVTANLESLTQKLDKIDYEATINNVNQTLSGLQQTTSTLNNAVETTLQSINSPNSSLGLLLNDPSLYNNLNKNLVSSDSLLNDLRLHPKRYVHFSIFGKKGK